VVKRQQSVQKTAARLVSGTIFRDDYYYSHAFYAAPLASGVAQNRFQEYILVSTYMNSAYDRLKIFEVVSGCRHLLDNQCQNYKH